LQAGASSPASRPRFFDVAHRYGVAVAKAADGQVDHTLLTTLVDRHGIMRVQYLGYRFDEEEFRHDLLDLVNEP
jgi:protein SCO1/2